MPLQDAFARRLAPLMRELVEQYGTPFHIYDLGSIVETHRTMQSAFGDWPFQQYFAVKALPNPAVLKVLVQAGSGLDCSSPAELRLAQASGAVGEAMVFTSNNTSPQEYRQALDCGAVITFDDRRYLERAEQLPPVVAYRVSPHGGAARSVLMGAAGESKFGVPREALADAYAEARRRGASRFGIHGMTCANELDVARAVQAAEDLIETALAVERALGITFEYLNFGGGLGIPYRPEDQPFDFGRFAAAIRAALAAAFPGRRPRVLMECGRYVSGPHGILVARVINRVSKEREIAGLDASMSALMRPGFYRTAYHHISLPFAGPRPQVVVDVVGALCENIDRFAVGRPLPDPAEGDIAYIHDTGAHGHAMGFTYNGRLRPAELAMTAGGEVVEVRRAETFDDYVATVRWEPVVVRKPSPAAHAGARHEQVAAVEPAGGNPA
jgi:diaminopimelate decarboxylase